MELRPLQQLNVSKNSVPVDSDYTDFSRGSANHLVPAWQPETPKAKDSYILLTHSQE